MKKRVTKKRTATAKALVESPTKAPMVPPSGHVLVCAFDGRIVGTSAESVRENEPAIVISVRAGELSPGSLHDALRRAADEVACMPRIPTAPAASSPAAPSDAEKAST